MNILQIQRLEKTYSTGVKALSGLNLSVPQGSIFGYIGPNGAGKTTTIRIIAGLEYADGGIVQYAGETLYRGSRTYKRTIGFVLDEPLYFDWMSSEDYLTFVGSMYGVDRDVIPGRVEEIIDFFDLRERGHEPIGTFSTGMKKKVSLAAAMIHRPQLLVLDEPLEGIDALATGVIKETLRLMAARGTTVFITSHILETIERLCNEVAIIKSGEVVLQCPMEEIRARVKNTLTRETYASLEELFIDVIAVKGVTRRLSWL